MDGRNSFGRRKKIPYHEKCQIKILKITCSRKLKHPCIKLTLGSKSYETCISNISEGLWNESFSFDVSFHSQLFSSIQLDLFECSSMFGKYHVGRAEIRLAHLDGLPETFMNWYEIWDKYRSPSNVSDIGQRLIVSDTIGAVNVEMRYKFQRLSHYSESADNEFPIARTHFNSSNSARLRYSSDEEENDDLYDSENDVTANDEMKTDDETDVDQIEDAFHMVDNSIKSVIAAWKGSGNLELNRDGEDAENNALFDIIEEEDEKVFSIRDNIFSLFFSKDNLAIIHGIESLIHAFGQGIENLAFSNASLFAAIYILKSHDEIIPRPSCCEYVTSLEFLEISRHYFKFALAAYGWKGLNFFGKGNGILSDSVRSQSDEKSVLEYLSIPKPDLLNFELTSENVFRPCYFLALDRFTSSIVLSIRGTMSVMDGLTDLVCEYQPWKGGLVHSGMLNSANWFIKNVLNQLISFCSLYDSEGLILVGHSLGAGTASLLTMMLYDYIEEFPKKEKFRIHCYAFAPPCIVSYDLSLKYKHCIDTFVYEDDLVCRLCYGSMMDFKTMLLCSIENCSNHIKEVLRILSGKAPTSESSKEIYRKLEDCRQAIRSRGPSDANAKLYMPGSIYHIYRKPTPENRKFTVLQKSDAKDFTEVFITTSMLMDHLPNKYEKGLDRVFEGLLSLDDARRLELNAFGSSSSFKDEVNEVVEMFGLP